MALVTQEHLASSNYDGPNWHKTVLSDLRDRLMPPSDFPCTFSQNAFRRELLLFAVVENRAPETFAALRADLSDYVSQSRDWDGQVNSARPLIVAFAASASQSQTLADYQRFGWKVLQDWHDHDPADWPHGVSTQPESPFWSMCFDGMQLFVNMSAPTHKHRKSRNLGQHFLFVVNPRERFDVVAGETSEGQRIRQVIRDRAENYDGQPHAPMLGKFLKGDLEWPQYALPDQGEAGLARCPLTSKT